MKYLILITIALFVLHNGVIAQKKLHEYKATNGVTYHLEDTVHLGRGSAPNGDFVQLIKGGVGGVMSYNSNNGSDQFNGNRFFANTNVIIKVIKEGNIKGATKVVFTVAGFQGRYYLSIDDAIALCEVTPCPNVTKPAINVADELTKLKALLDSG